LTSVFKVPGWLYRKRLGWILGKRFLSVTHRGRKTGLSRQTVLEVIIYDPSTQESIVASAYGTSADWYRNLMAGPALEVRTGRHRYRPEQRFLDDQEAREMAARFCRLHPFEARLAPRVLPAIGAVSVDARADPIDVIASLPMMGFRPRG
jgi:deazaflavin-dependent oxidoreductase (nitroreductase family)